MRYESNIPPFVGNIGGDGDRFDGQPPSDNGAFSSHRRDDSGPIGEMIAHPLPQLLAALAGAAHVPSWTDQERRDIASHLMTCERCRRVLVGFDIPFDEVLRIVFPYGDATGKPETHRAPGAIPDDETLAAYAVSFALEGAQSARDRFPMFADHIAVCAFCQQTLEFLTEGLAEDIAEVERGPDSTAPGDGAPPAQPADEWDWGDISLIVDTGDTPDTNGNVNEGGMPQVDDTLAMGSRNDVEWAMNDPAVTVNDWVSVSNTAHRLSQPFHVYARPLLISIAHPDARMRILGKTIVGAQRDASINNGRLLGGETARDDPGAPGATVQRIILDLVAPTINASGADNPKGSSGQPARWVRVVIQLRAELSRRIAGEIEFTRREANGATQPAPDVAWQIVRETAPGEAPPESLPSGISDSRGVSRIFLAEAGEYALVAQVDGRQWIIPFSITKSLSQR